jgi:hypothetical protein
MSSSETNSKYLIYMNFAEHAYFLWITLLIYCRHRCQSLENQGACRNARKKSKDKNPYESIACVRYWFYSRASPI